MFLCQYGPNIIFLFAKPGSTTQREGTGFVWKYPAQQIQLRRLLVSFFLKDPKLLGGLFFCLSCPSFCLLPTPSSPLDGSHHLKLSLSIPFLDRIHLTCWQGKNLFSHLASPPRPFWVTPGTILRTGSSGSQSPFPAAFVGGGRKQHIV